MDTDHTEAGARDEPAVRTSFGARLGRDLAELRRPTTPTLIGLVASASVVALVAHAWGGVALLLAPVIFLLGWGAVALVMFAWTRR